MRVPRSMAVRCTTAWPSVAAGRNQVGGPPSHHAGVPSGSSTSAGPPQRAPAATAWSAHGHGEGPARRSTALAVTRWARTSVARSRAAGWVQAGPVRTSGAGSSSATTNTVRWRAWRRSHSGARTPAVASLVSWRRTSATSTTGAAAHGSGTGWPGATMASRPSHSGPAKRSESVPAGGGAGAAGLRSRSGSGSGSRSAGGASSRCSAAQARTSATVSCTCPHAHRMDATRVPDQPVRKYGPSAAPAAPRRERPAGPG